MKPAVVSFKPSSNISNSEKEQGEKKQILCQQEQPMFLFSAEPTTVHGNVAKLLPANGCIFDNLPKVMDDLKMTLHKRPDEEHGRDHQLRSRNNIDQFSSFVGNGITDTHYVQQDKCAAVRSKWRRTDCRVSGVVDRCLLSDI